MKRLKQNSGIDISKDSFYASFSILTEDLSVLHLSTKMFKNTIEGIEAYYQWIKKFYDAKVPMSYTMEATGVYYEQLAYYLSEQKQTVNVLLPTKAKNYAKSLNIKQKTDKVDAKILGQMGLKMQFRQWRASTTIFAKLRTLTRERESLVNQKTLIKNELHAEKHKKQPFKQTLNRLKNHLEFIENQITTIELEIKNIVAGNKELNEKVKKIISIPGVSLLTAITIISETNGFLYFSSIKQLTSYAGYDIRIKESGQYKGKSKISKKGNKHIRRVLYMPAMTHIKYSEKAKNFYERLKEKKSNGLIALTAVQRKLLTLIYTLWKNDSIFTQNYQSNK